ncbi:MAG: hypothetical protein IPK18_11810 [Sphingobacteriales bacterium]|nr:MAG: hypothetical protein IPK18_11810 [Sphingobacteriales bacterium]
MRIISYNTSLKAILIIFIWSIVGIKTNTIVAQDSIYQTIDTAIASNLEDVIHKSNFNKLKKKSIPTQEIPQSSIEKSKKKIFDDSTRSSAKHAALLGLAFPGLGQVYNKKYWKLPIVYGGIAGCIFWVSRQAKALNNTTNIWYKRTNGITLPTGIERYSTAQLESIRNTHRRSVQLASFVTMMVWGFTILDAAVDAHIKPFDISENLSMQIKPSIKQSNFQEYVALQVNLNLR